MRAPSCCSLAVLTFVAALSTGCPRPSFEPTDEAAIVDVLHTQQEAWNRGDLEAFMQGYHRDPEVVFTSSAKIRRGYDATLTSYRKRYVEGDAKMGTLEFSDLEVTGLGPDAALAFGRFELTGTPQESTGVFSLVFTRRQGRWGIIHDHSSVPVEQGCP
jgi:uncharacterized protein (TIGR02246 family)